MFVYLFYCYIIIMYELYHNVGTQLHILEVRGGRIRKIDYKLREHGVQKDDATLLSCINSRIEFDNGLNVLLVTAGVK